MGWCFSDSGASDGSQLWTVRLPEPRHSHHLADSSRLAFFSEAKARFKDSSMGPRTQTLAASAVAGFFASFFSLPFDFIKTRLQKQSKGPDGKLPYKGFVDCFQKVIREEGPLRFYRGFSTYYVRIAPHAMVTLIVADYLNFITK